MSELNKVDYGPQVTALAAVAMNGAAAARTSDAIEVRGQKYLRVEWSYVLVGAAATDTVTFSFQGSQDNGSSFKPIQKISTADVISDFAPIHTLTAAEKSAALSARDLGSIKIAGLTHVKLTATHTNVAGTVGANDLMTVKVRASRG